MYGEENTSVIKMELDVKAKKLISQYMILNETIENDIQAGVENAFKNFDFKKAVEEQVKRAINNAVRNALDYGVLATYVKKASDKIIAQTVEDFLKDPNKKPFNKE